MDYTIRVYAKDADTDKDEPLLTLETDERKYGRALSLLSETNPITVIVTKEAAPKVVKFAKPERKPKPTPEPAKPDKANKGK